MAVPTTFEKELHKIFDGIDNLENKKYVGRAFYASIDNNTKFKAEFISTNSYEHFDALRIRVLHKDEGELDANTIRLKEAWGMKPVANGNFPNGVSPHMWIDRGQLEWYASSYFKFLLECRHVISPLTNQKIFFLFLYPI